MPSIFDTAIPLSARSTLYRAALTPVATFRAQLVLAPSQISPAVETSVFLTAISISSIEPSSKYRIPPLNAALITDPELQTAESTPT